MKVLVTGGGGFLGGAIVRQLTARGDTVRSLARGAYPALEKIGVEVQRGDLAEAQAVLKAVQGCEAVIHVAAKAGIWGSYQDYYQSNVVGTENVIAACQQVGINKLVYTSSPSVIDNGQDIVNGDESLPYPTKFVLPYAKTKAFAEQIVLKANRPTFMTVAIRPPLIWGPGDNFLVPRMIERAKAGRVVRVGYKNSLLDTTYIDNAAAAHLLALDRLFPGSPILGKVYFISNDEPIPGHEMINRIIATAGYPPAKITLPESVAYGAAWVVEKLYKGLRLPKEPPLTSGLIQQLTKARWFNISAAKRDLGYVPQVSIDEGLKRLAASWDQ